MEVIIAETAHDVAVVVADAVERVLRTEDRPVLGLATGSTPIPTYNELARRHAAGLSFTHARAFLLDEYVGLAPGHPESYRAFIEREFTTKIDLPPGALFGPDGTPSLLEAEGERYEREIRDAGGIDLQILGIGSDGHIGFNEPTSSLASRTRLKTLTTETIEANSRFFGDDQSQVPRHVITQGVGTILDADHLVLIATGHEKARPVAMAVEGPVTAMVPASALQLHRHATVVIDEAAAAELVLADYYRHAYLHKPSWQPV